MTSPTPARKLTVLVVDDQVAPVLAEHRVANLDYVELRVIESWADAQRQCAKEGELGGVDIVLIDVSFERDASIEKLIEHNRLLPAGPFLALPFIGKRSVMACVTYSAHMANPELQAHPYFLLGMGLILSRAQGIPFEESALHSRHLSNGAGPKQLDVEISRLASGGFTTPLGALAKGLRDYRESLAKAIKSSSIILVNRYEMLGQLQQLRERIDISNEPVDHEGLHLTLVGHGWRDALRISSLFADHLSINGKWVTPESIDLMEKWLRDLGASTPLQSALRAIIQQELQEDRDGTRPDIRKVILEIMGRHTSAEELSQILRLCVLFANVWAIENPNSQGQVTRESVLARLGEKLDVNTYLSWFGERRHSNGIAHDGRRRPRARSPQAGAFKVLSPLSVGADKYDRCFLSLQASRITTADADAVRRYRDVEEWAEWRVFPFQRTCQKFCVRGGFQFFGLMNRSPYNTAN